MDIRHIDLPRAWLRGYPRQDVDELLEEIARSFEEVWQERTRLADRLHEMEVEDAKHGELERLLRSTLLSTERAAEEIKAQAAREADLIVHEAYAESRRTTRELAAEKRRLEYDVARIQAHLRAAFAMVGERPTREQPRSEESVSATGPPALDEALDAAVRKAIG